MSMANQRMVAVGNETDFPPMQCDQCGLERVIELRSWTEKNYGRVFLKCSRNIAGVSDFCGCMEFSLFCYFVLIFSLAKSILFLQAPDRCGFYF